MRSRTEPARRALEGWLRFASLASLAALAWLLVSGGFALPGAATVRDEALEGAGGALAAWTSAPRAGTLELVLRAVPPRPARDWLAALRRGGVGVRWRGDSLTPLAVEAEAAMDPGGGLRVLVAAPGGARVVLADTLGVQGSVAAAGGGAAFAIGAAARGLRAGAPGASASLAAPDSPARRRVVVLGRAGWETKFVTRALEERGWAVDSRACVAPGVDVTQGGPFPLDTARHAAVVALDSLGDAEARSVVSFVRDGGGLVLAARAAVGGLRAPAAGGIGRRVRPAAVLPGEAAPRRGLGLLPVEPLRPGAVVLERRDGMVAAAARRWGAGRVVQVGYVDTWRWRMGGEGDAVEAHRGWWASVVAAAAYRPHVAAPAPRDAADPAPYATLVAALGGPSAASEASRVPSRLRLVPLLALFCLAALGAELASRRLRGAP